MRIHVLAGCLLAGSLWASQSKAAGKGRTYGMAGCGLGAAIFKKDAAVSAATTNSSFYSQLLGISSGTLGCKTDAELYAHFKQLKFLEENITEFQTELAQGQGPTLVSYLNLLGCDDAVINGASLELKGQFGQVFSQPGIEAIHESSKSVLKNDESLSTQCKYLG